MFYSLISIYQNSFFIFFYYKEHLCINHAFKKWEQMYKLIWKVYQFYVPNGIVH